MLEAARETRDIQHAYLWETSRIISERGILQTTSASVAGYATSQLDSTEEINKVKDMLLLILRTEEMQRMHMTGKSYIPFPSSPTTLSPHHYCYYTMLHVPDILTKPPYTHVPMPTLVPMPMSYLMSPSTLCLLPCPALPCVFTYSTRSPHL